MTTKPGPREHEILGILWDAAGPLPHREILRRWEARGGWESSNVLGATLYRMKKRGIVLRVTGGYVARVTLTDVLPAYHPALIAARAELRRREQAARDLAAAALQLAESYAAELDGR